MWAGPFADYFPRFGQPGNKFSREFLLFIGLVSLCLRVKYIPFECVIGRQIEFRLIRRINYKHLILVRNQFFHRTIHLLQCDRAGEQPELLKPESLRDYRFGREKIL